MHHLRSPYRLVASTAVILLLGLSTACSPQKTAVQSSASPPSTPPVVGNHYVTGRWIFDGPLQLMVDLRRLPYAPGNYALKPGNQLYQALMEAQDLYDQRKLRLSGHFELTSASQAVAETDELRGYGGNSIVGKTLLLTPSRFTHFSVLFQVKKGLTPSTFRAVFLDPAIRPVTVRIRHFSA